MTLMVPPPPSRMLLQSPRMRGGLGLVPSRITGAGSIWNVNPIFAFHVGSSSSVVAAFLLWQEDPALAAMAELDPLGVVATPFNPTAENMAEYLVNTVAGGLFALSFMLGILAMLIVGIVPTIIVVVIGVTYGLVSGWLGGRWDNILMRLVDVVYAFPSLLLFIIFQAALRDSWLGRSLGGLTLLFVAFAITGWNGMARLIRGETMRLREQEFVVAARAIVNAAGPWVERFLHGIAGQKGWSDPLTSDVVPQMAIMMTAPPSQSRHSFSHFCRSRAGRDSFAAPGCASGTAGRSAVTGSSSP